MKIAFSPCPNDTFVFHAAVHGKIPEAPKLDVTYADIDKTNYWADEGIGPEIQKISYAALPYVLDEYALIPCGGALGRGCGPLLLTAGGDQSPRSLAGKRVAVPSERSTAYLLFRLWAAEAIPEGLNEIVVMPFHEIMPAVRDGKIDAGLVIHEARFTYQEFDLKMLVDLGEWWEKDTGLPIPLGAIIAHRSLNKEEITNWVRASVEYAWENPEASVDYVMEHAQELSYEVAKSHIDLYVNSFTQDLGEEGLKAVASLLGRAGAEGLVPEVDLSLLKE
ncbi:1,4-dihydroxy-6-naphthoate synthase [Alkalihalophilus marmarensis]|uniref:1,4-dihydroxy-6-naphthoate synthase n=1 Tax=Alkalihalophilus marmarensis TaxID=521377 RepID=UPI002041E3F0|nr:1,4-dihydroxy-6-naphthoate synthase [Alkalihalophilus marmarensis]MCM3491277.1 1,4-dihydroxy-6-naphthoate synthase [Alkalihalophilus marmarensis]